MIDCLGLGWIGLEEEEEDPFRIPRHQVKYFEIDLVQIYCVQHLLIGI